MLGGVGSATAQDAAAACAQPQAQEACLATCGTLCAERGFFAANIAYCRENGLQLDTPEDLGLTDSDVCPLTHDGAEDGANDADDDFAGVDCDTIVDFDRRRACSLAQDEGATPDCAGLPGEVAASPEALRRAAIALSGRIARELAEFATVTSFDPEAIATREDLCSRSPQRYRDLYEEAVALPDMQGLQVRAQAMATCADAWATVTRQRNFQTGSDRFAATLGDEIETEITDILSGQLSRITTQLDGMGGRADALFELALAAERYCTPPPGTRPGQTGE